MPNSEITIEALLMFFPLPENKKKKGKKNNRLTYALCFTALQSWIVFILAQHNSGLYNTSLLVVHTDCMRDSPAVHVHSFVDSNERAAVSEIS